MEGDGTVALSRRLLAHKTEGIALLCLIIKNMNKVLFVTFKLAWGQQLLPLAVPALVEGEDLWGAPGGRDGCLWRVS